MKTILQYLSLFLFLIFLNGCAKKLEITEKPIDFQFITIKNGDTFQSLAKEYNDSEKLAWRIEEFNVTKQLIPGQELIIPLKPFRPGGLTAQGYQLVPVLSYHNFCKGWSNNTLTVSAKNFRDQLNYLKNHNYHVITIDQLLGFLEFGQVPEKSVLISIDDGWISSYKIAYPILKDFGFNATLFIPSHFIESGKKNAVSWDQIREMVSDSTIDIQCHTKSHRDLSTMKGSESFTDYMQAVEQDILHSKQTIYNKLGKEVIALAYPFGNTNSLVMAIIKKHGYKAAFTVKRKGNPFYKQSFLLNRSMIFGTFNINRFAKNLKTFEEFKITESEPIDTLSSLANIALSNPEDYESKSQWRTAVLAWKLRRDRLISQKHSGSTKTDVESLDQSILNAKQKVFDLTSKLNEIAKQYYSIALKNIDNKKAKKPLLQALLYSPESQAPIDLFQTNMGKLRPLIYQVKENDSFSSIAHQLYQDPKKAILIPLFHDNINDENDLVPGIKLSLPALTVGTEIVSTSAKACNIVLTESKEQMAIEYYDKAIENFNLDQIPKAIENLKTAICLNPKLSQAIEMLEMLKDL